MALVNESILRNQFSLILVSPLLFTFLPRQRKIQGLGINRKQGKNSLHTQGSQIERYGTQDSHHMLYHPRDVLASFGMVLLKLRGG